jgi:hypothetical protein
MAEPKGFKTANRRYLQAFWPLMAVYVVTVAVTSFFIDMDTAAVWVRIASAAATSLPLAGVLWVMLRLISETDEYTRLRQLTAMARGGAITAAIATFVGFLQIYGAVDSFPVFLLGPCFFLAYGFSYGAACFGKTV